MLSRRKIEIIVITVYTLLTLKAVYPFLSYVLPATWGGFLDTRSMFVALNNNLMAISIGIFLNTALVLYFKIIAKKKYEAIVVAIYTLINLKLLSIPFLDFFTSYGGTMIYSENVPGFNLLPLFVGLFLNAVLIIYWMRRDAA